MNTSSDTFAESAHEEKWSESVFRRIKKESEDIEMRILALKESVGAHGISYENTCHGGSELPEAQRFVEQSEMLRNLYQKKLSELRAEQLKIETAISGLPPNLRTLMRYRYIDGMTCEAVCVKIPCAWMTFHRWHKAALEELSKDGIE